MKNQKLSPRSSQSRYMDTFPSVDAGQSGLFPPTTAGAGDFNAEIGALCRPIVNYCDQKFKGHGLSGEQIMNSVMRTITGLPDLPTVITYLTRVRASVSDPVVQKLRDWRPELVASADVRSPVPPAVYLEGWHRTDGATAGEIMKTEFRCGVHGMFGAAIYFATTPQDVRGKSKAGEGPVLRCRVRVDRMYRPMRPCKDMTLAKLNAMGYDSVYAEPEPASVSRPEFCVFEPWRCTVIGVGLDPSNPMQNIRMAAHSSIDPFSTPMTLLTSCCGARMMRHDGACEACGKVNIEY